MKKITLLALVMLGNLMAQSDYCSDHCMGTPDQRTAPMGFWFSFTRSVEHYIEEPQARAKKLKKCQQAFNSTLRINYITKSFRRDCENAEMAEKQAKSEQAKNEPTSESKDTHTQENSKSVSAKESKE
ncbi:hypothetical protein HCW_03035 [Helicobacter cetorum MIT 00-7128]|uniref:Uncharacterized protein n=1 Tax=Helicobacter cetorum (strain ATCC BAA-429 / MIT 00-7128) TaxID=182217 RepID=I0ELR9_HELC0|nr:hypothetical protein HCW_03035 [Helicobacter cetorum MIT 00-7128]